MAGRRGRDERDRRRAAFLEAVTEALGSFPAVVLAVASVLLWAAVGPLFGFSEAWQLVVNTGTTIASYWMGFVIQATQNRDNRALHVKLDAVLRAVDEVPNELVGLEHEPSRLIKAEQRRVALGAEEAEPPGADEGGREEQGDAGEDVAGEEPQDPGDG